MPGWRFTDPVAENNFLQQYCAPRFSVRLAAMMMLMLAQLVPVLFSRLAEPAGVAANACDASNFWTTVAGLPIVLLLVAAVGSVYFVTYWGHVSMLCQILVASGLGFAVRPACCAVCPFIWQHRVLLASVVGISSPVLTHHYILGGIFSWLAASLVGYADPQASCGQSVVCIASAVQQLTAACASRGPMTLAHHVLQGLVSHTSRGHLADWLLPGLLVCYLEGRSRSSWLAQHRQQLQQQPIQQQQISSHAGSMATTAAAGAVDARHVHWEEGSVTDSHAQAGAAASTGTGRAPAASVAPPAAPHRPVSSRVNRLIAARIAAGLPLYVSPVRSKLVSIKLNAPQAAGPAEYAGVTQALKDALDVFYCQQPSGDEPPDGLPLAGPAAPGIVAEWAAFPGCWQLAVRVLCKIHEPTPADASATVTVTAPPGCKASA